MRTVTAGEQTVLESAGFRVVDRVQVKNGSGTWKDLTALGSPAVSYLIGGQYEENIDQPVSQLSVVLRRSEGALSLAPLNETSVLNRLDDGTTYSPLLDPGRDIKWDRATVAWGATPLASDWKPKFEGVIDKVDWAGHEITVEVRDRGGRLVDHFATQPETFDLTATPQALEDFIQERVLDSQFGAGVIPLWTPVSPSYQVKTFRHDRESTMELLQRLVLETKAWDLRYWWKSDTSEWRLRLGDPNRTKTVPDFTLPASMYLSARRLEIDRGQVRNRIEVVFGPSSARQTATADDAASQARFGYRVLHIELDENSPITTLAEGTAMAEAILSDLALPKAGLELELLPYWPVELFDLGRINANTKYFTANQDLAVVGIRHTLGERKRTFLAIRGKPAGAYRSWWVLTLPSPAPDAPRPTAKLTLQTRYPMKELINLEGALGSPELGPLEYRTKEEPAAWSAWASAPALPQSVLVSRAPGYTKGYRLQTRQADGQVSEIAYIGVPPRINDSGNIPREDDDRAGRGGVPVRRARFDTFAVYRDDGTAALIDTELGRVTGDLFGPSGTHAMDVVETGGGRGFGGFSSDTGDLVSTARDSRAALLNNHFRYGTDGAAGVVESATQSFAHTSYLDGSRRPITLRNATLARDVVANDIDVGQERSRGGFSNATGGLVSTAADSRSALLNNHFRYGTDGAAGVVESATQSFVHQSYLDGSRRPATLRNATLARDVVANDIDVGQERSRGGFSNATGGLVSTAADSRSALLNNHFRYATDSAAGIVETASQSFVHTSYVDASRRPVTMRDPTLGQDVAGNDINVGQSRARTALNSDSKLQTGVTAAATAADGYGNIESARGAKTKASHLGAGGGRAIVEDGVTRRGDGGLAVRDAFIPATGLYDETGAVPLIDAATKEILSGLGIGSGVRGAADVVFGGTIKFATNRHNEQVSGVNTDIKTFGTSYEQVPETRVLPQVFKAPTAGNTVKFEAYDVTVSGCKIRAVEISSFSTTAQTDDFAATLNGTPEAAGISIGAPGSAAYCNLPDANATSTTYKVYFDVNTTSKVGGGLMRVTAYKNDGASSTNWTQVGQKTYDDGVNITGEVIEFTAALGANFDVRLVVTYSSGTPTTNGTVVADRVDYDVVSGGTESTLTPTGSAILVQAVEKS